MVLSNKEILEFIEIVDDEFKVKRGTSAKMIKEIKMFQEDFNKIHTKKIEIDYSDALEWLKRQKVM